MHSLYKFHSSHKKNFANVDNMHGCCIKGLVTLKVTIFGEEATSALAGFHGGPLSQLNLNLEVLVFVEGGKLKTLEKTLWCKARTNSKRDPLGHTGDRRACQPLCHPFLPCEVGLTTSLFHIYLLRLCLIIALLGQGSGLGGGRVEETQRLAIKPHFPHFICPFILDFVMKEAYVKLYYKNMQSIV